MDAPVWLAFDLPNDYSDHSDDSIVTASQSDSLDHQSNEKESF